MGGEADEWGHGASQSASTSARQDVAASTAPGSQAYLAVLAHAEEFVARTVHDAIEAAADKPEEEEDKPEKEEADWCVINADALSEISDDDDKEDKVPVLAENELPILCRCRADLQATKARTSRCTRTRLRMCPCSCWQSR